MDYKDIANRLRKWANGETCEDCPAKTDLAFCAADAIRELLSKVEALRSVSREQVEKVWKGCQSCKSCRSCVYNIHDLKDMPCKKCDPNAEGIVTEYKPSNFCPACGKPLTDEAVDIVMERLEALHGETD